MPSLSGGLEAEAQILALNVGLHVPTAEQPRTWFLSGR